MSKKCHLYFANSASHHCRYSLRFSERRKVLAECRNHFTRPDNKELEIWEESHHQKCWKQNVFCYINVYWKHSITKAFLRQTKTSQETITYGIFHISSNLTFFFLFLNYRMITNTSALYWCLTELCQDIPAEEMPQYHPAWDASLLLYTILQHPSE